MRRKESLMLMSLLTITLAFTCVPGDGIAHSDSLADLIEIVSDPELPHKARAAAEHTLMERHDSEALRLLLPQFNRPLLLIGTYGSPDLGPEGDAYMPPEHQVRYALDRVWRHFAQNGQPEEQRKRVYAALIDKCETDRQWQAMFEAAIWNHSPELEQKLWAIIADRDRAQPVRTASVNLLVTVAPRKHTSQIVEVAWREKGSVFATNVGGRLGGPRNRDPRLGVLMIDWYERERNLATRHSRMSIAQLVDRMDASFQNITGLHRDRRASMSSDEIEHRNKRLKLWQEARETGDDTKLREFEAELAERQRQELETRIERIDAWITANRERLEQEAVAFEADQQRRREQRPTREVPRPREQ